jgi:nitrate reductase NapE component
MSKRDHSAKREHWLFGVAACLWPIAFAVVGIFGDWSPSLLKAIGIFLR